ncbi:MAG: iron donor protein CyaY [Rickettsiales bacterium]|nr:MAG: iron donor protein CyaY [Rickettsiales bacterium]
MKDHDIEFVQESERIITEIADAIEDQDEECLIDVDLNSSILTLTAEQGTFVINKQTAAQEIWLSSPISGPYHFKKDKGYWRSRDGTELFEILAKELPINIKW